MECLNEIDNMLLEYLLFRGFTASFETVKKECENDKLQGLSSERVAAQLFGDIENSNFENLWKLWMFLDKWYFAKIHDDSLANNAEKLRDMILKFYLISAVRLERQEMVAEFFNYFRSHTDEASFLFTHDWREWYSLLYAVNPENDPLFAPYFHKSWEGALYSSLVNYLSKVFSSLSTPRILRYKSATAKHKMLNARVQVGEIQKEVLQLNRKLYKPEKMYIKLASNKSSAKIAARTIEDREKTNIPLKNMEMVSSHNAAISACKVNGDYVATASLDCTARIVNFESKARNIIYDDAPILSLDWLSSGKDNALLSLGSSANTVKLWNVKTRQIVMDFAVSNPLLPLVTCVKFCPRSQLLITSCINENSPSWRDTNGLLLKTNLPPRVSTGYERLSSNLEIWNYTTGSFVKTLFSGQNSINAMCFNHNGTLLVTGATDGYIRIFDVSQGSIIMGWCANENVPIEALCITPDETAVTCLSRDGVLKLWSLHKLREAIRDFTPFYEIAVKDTSLKGNLTSVIRGDIAFLPGNKRFVVSHPKSRQVIMYSMDDIKTAYAVETGHTAPVTSLDVGQSEELFVGSLAGRLNSIRIDGKRLQDLNQNTTLKSVELFEPA